MAIYKAQKIPFSGEIQPGSGRRNSG